MLYTNRPPSPKNSLLFFLADDSCTCLISPLYFKILMTPCLLLYLVLVLVHRLPGGGAPQIPLRLNNRTKLMVNTLLGLLYTQSPFACIFSLACLGLTCVIFSTRVHEPGTGRQSARQNFDSQVVAIHLFTLTDYCSEGPCRSV